MNTNTLRKIARQYARAGVTCAHAWQAAVDAVPAIATARRVFEIAHAVEWAACTTR